MSPTMRHLSTTPHRKSMRPAKAVALAALSRYNAITPQSMRVLSSSLLLSPRSSLRRDDDNVLMSNYDRDVINTNHDNAVVVVVVESTGDDDDVLKTTSTMKVPPLGDSTKSFSSSRGDTSSRRTKRMIVTPSTPSVAAEKLLDSSTTTKRRVVIQNVQKKKKKKGGWAPLKTSSSPPPPPSKSVAALAQPISTEAPHQWTPFLLASNLPLTDDHNGNDDDNGLSNDQNDKMDEDGPVVVSSSSSSSSSSSASLSSSSSGRLRHLHVVSYRSLSPDATFPERLWCMVHYCHVYHPHLIRWTKGGRFLYIFAHHPDLADIIRRYFNHCKYLSLQRQLNNYGFYRHKVYGYYHPHFYHDSDPDQLDNYLRYQGRMRVGSGRKTFNPDEIIDIDLLGGTNDDDFHGLTPLSSSASSSVAIFGPDASPSFESSISISSSSNNKNNIIITSSEEEMNASHPPSTGTSLSSLRCSQGNRKGATIAITIPERKGTTVSPPTDAKKDPSKMSISLGLLPSLPRMVMGSAEERHRLQRPFAPDSVPSSEATIVVDSNSESSDCTVMTPSSFVYKTHPAATTMTTAEVAPAKATIKGGFKNRMKSGRKIRQTDVSLTIHSHRRQPESIYGKSFRPITKTTGMRPTCTKMTIPGMMVPGTSCLSPSGMADLFVASTPPALSSEMTKSLLDTPSPPKVPHGGHIDPMGKFPIVQYKGKNGPLAALADAAAAASTSSVANKSIFNERGGVRVLSWTTKPLAVSPIVVEQGRAHIQSNTNAKEHGSPPTPSYNHLLGKDVISTPCSSYIAQYDVSPSYFVPSSVFSPNDGSVMDSVSCSGNVAAAAATDVDGSGPKMLEITVGGPSRDNPSSSRTTTTTSSSSSIRTTRLSPLNQVQLRAMARELTECLMGTP